MFSQWHDWCHIIVTSAVVYQDDHYTTPGPVYAKPPWTLNDNGYFASYCVMQRLEPFEASERSAEDNANEVRDLYFTILLI